MESHQVNRFTVLFICCCFLSVPSIVLAVKIFQNKNTKNTFFNQIVGVMFLTAGTYYGELLPFSLASIHELHRLYAKDEGGQE